MHCIVSSGNERLMVHARHNGFRNENVSIEKLSSYAERAHLKLRSSLKMGIKLSKPEWSAVRTRACGLFLPMVGLGSVELGRAKSGHGSGWSVSHVHSFGSLKLLGYNKFSEENQFVVAKRFPLKRLPGNQFVGCTRIYTYLECRMLEYRMLHGCCLRMDLLRCWQNYVCIVL